jgi:putative sugar O-methyltransferase
MWLERLNRFMLKVKTAWLDGTLWKRALRFLPLRIIPFSDVVLGYITLARTDRRLDLSTGFADHRQDPHHHRSDPDHLRRIIAAYRASKDAQPQAAPPFQIRGMWAEVIATNYQQLISALQSADVHALSALLENFNREHYTAGTGGTGYEHNLMYRTSPMGGPYIKTVWTRYRDHLLSSDYDLREVRFPLVGNPAGIYLNGDVVQINVFRHSYHAREMCDLLRDVPGATVVEIGGGTGAQCYQTTRLSRGSVAKHLVFDIPEVAVTIAYFLLSAFPEKRIRLFGEGPVSVDPSEAYDIAVFPHFEIDRLADQSVDLFHNACSFSEMDSASSREYLRIIQRTCRRYFSHVNHDVRFTIPNPDGSTSVNTLGSELVPDPALFKRVFKKPRVFYLPEDKGYPAFEFLYERMKSATLR